MNLHNTRSRRCGRVFRFLRWVNSSRWPALGLVMVLAGLLLVSCQSKMSEANSSAPTRDINAVLADHDDQLLAIDGVVGVYVGQLEDGRTLCLKVMLARQSKELERKIPRTIEGHPVVTEVTGEIRPLGKP